MAQLSKARVLREERKKLVLDAQTLANKDGVTADELSQVDRMITDERRMMSEITRLEALDSSASEFRTNAPPDAQLTGSLTEEETTKRENEADHKAWLNYMRLGWQYKPTSSGHEIRGINQVDQTRLVQARNRALINVDPKLMEAINRELRMLNQAEFRDMGTGGQGAYPGATTGFFVPVGFTDAILEALKYYGPMLNGGPGNPEIFETSTGAPLPFPTDNDTIVTGELVGENQQVTGADVNIGQIMMGAYKYSTRIVKVSIELLQDSAFALEPYLIRKFAIRLGRILNNHFTVGTGSGMPNGIVPKALRAQVGGVDYTAVGSSSNTGNADGTNTIGSDDLTNLEHSVDPLYRPGAKFMMHDNTLRALKIIKDKFGRPLWLPGLAVRAVDTILGYEYLINNDMDTLQVNPSSPPVSRKTVLFGQLSLYKIRRVKEMSVLRLEERYADQGQVAFLGFARYDGTLMDAGTGPVRYLVNTY